MRGRGKTSSKKARNLESKYSGKSVKSDNLHVPLTPSTFRKIKTSASRVPASNSRSAMTRQRKSAGEGEPGSILRLSHTRSSELPENLAVHFSSFYRNESKALPHTAEEEPPVAEPKTLRNFPKMEFTRQMVHKLEHFAGTQNYGRQVSAVLEDTVEAPGFNLKLPPVDNCAPFRRGNDYYPLWYRDPNKMPQMSGEKFQEMKEKYNREIATSKSHAEGTSGSSETETESEEDETGCRDYSNFCRAEASHMFGKSSKSSGSKEEKDTLFDIAPKMLSKSYSEDGSRSSETSGEFGAKDAEEESSLDWETEEEEEEKVEVEIVSNLEKKFVVDRV